MRVFPLIFICLLLPACAMVHESSPVKGGGWTKSVTKEIIPTKDGVLTRQTTTETLTEPDNAKTPTSRNEAKDGSTDIVLGTVTMPTFVIPPAPDWSKYIALAAGIIFLGGGIALAAYGSPRMGTNLAIAGGVMIVVAMTMGQFGWVYVLIIAAASGFLLYEQWASYKKGLMTPVPAPLPATI